MLSFLLTSLAVLALYIFIVLHFYDKGKFPPSLSYTYYWLDEKKRGLGYLFTGVMFVCSLAIIPAWIEATNDYWTCLPFLAVVGLCMVAAAPFYRDKPLAEKIHVLGADLAALMSFVWAVVSGYWWVWLVAVAVVGLVAYYTGTAKSSKTWHLEMVAFLATYMGLICSSL